MHKPGYVNSHSLEHIARTVAEIKRRFLDALAIEPGQRVLDVGCGPASDTLDMGRLTGPGGLVVGVDVDEEMIARDRERAHQRMRCLGAPYASRRGSVALPRQLFPALP
jgi:precorrin-6B methylase 2